MTQKPPAIFLLGPTASGKTEIAVRLVEDLPCEIISVDSAMVYRGLDIGTAKPDATILQKAPHRLIDICDPAEAYSAAQFAEDALREMNDIYIQGKIPLLVGGTFLYFRALAEGLSPLPAADPKARAQLDAEAKVVGWAEMHQRLTAVDPETASRVHPNDPQRIQRALEVYALTGEAMSSILRRDNPGELPYNVCKLILAPSDRSVLHDRIAIRFNRMLKLGLVNEVEQLYRRSDLHKDLPSIRAVGYRQVWAYLGGELRYDEMIQKGIAATRQFAKRQFTWLRSEKEEMWFDALENNIYSKILKKLLNNPILGNRI
ncbi:MAG: tRNA (adenosine(37)-N6)-dimethylallyltransferase MiaA [Gammaproteobacteria bacterium]|nr:tRNA (adenosine(37)-N6)-dimethylallyltransferase MiaA [Gammaproteobacteria bacterium]